MITKISKLKGFGIFQDFTWNDLTTFKKKNLIYGLNYSGKTTLSKLFQNLEFKDKNRHFQGSEFEIIIEFLLGTSQIQILSLFHFTLVTHRANWTRK